MMVIEAEQNFWIHHELGGTAETMAAAHEYLETVQFQLDPLNEEAPKRDACILHVAAILRRWNPVPDEQVILIK